MIPLYIILAIGAIVLASWIIWTLNTELELYCWINGMRVFRGYFPSLGDLNDHVIKLEALHGNSLTDWTIRTVRKHKPVKQVNDKLFVSMMSANFVSDELIKQNPMEKTLTAMQNAIDTVKQTIKRTNQYLDGTKETIVGSIGLYSPVRSSE